MPWEMPVRVVSLPAKMKSWKKLRYSVSVRRSPLDHPFGGNGTDGGQWDNGLDALTGIEG